MKSRIDIVGQNGNDGLHYEPDDGQLTDEQYAKIKEYEYELDKSTGEVVKKYPSPILDLEKQLYENHMLQSKSDGVIKK